MVPKVSLTRIVQFYVACEVMPEHILLLKPAHPEHTLAELPFLAVIGEPGGEYIIPVENRKYSLGIISRAQIFPQLCAQT